jgi:hypothetical protein
MYDAQVLYNTPHLPPGYNPYAVPAATHPIYTFELKRSHFRRCKHHHYNGMHQAREPRAHFQ